jgi:hypothetical protein
MAEVEPPAPVDPTLAPAPIPVPSSDSPPSMENLFTLFPFPQEYNCSGIVSWIIKMNKMGYQFKRETLEWMLEEAGHTISQCISNILAVICEHTLPSWASEHPLPVITYRLLCPFTPTSTLPLYLYSPL